MKKAIIVCCILFFAISSFAQTKRITISKAFVKDTTLPWIKNDSTNEKLPNLAKAKDSIHFRFSRDIQAIDIWTNDYKTFFGTFSNFTRGNTYKREKKKKPYQFYIETAP